MAVGDGAALGITAAQRLAAVGRTTIRPGLTALEFGQVEHWFGFEFADDHRAFLAHGLPVWTEGDDDHHKTTDMAWPDWRDGDPGRLREQLDLAIEGALQQVEDGYWHPWWGDQRPAQPSEALRVARARLVGDGPPVPEYVHRFLPAGRNRWGHPVLSTWGTRRHLLRDGPSVPRLRFVT
jgi:hypothetical protein